MMPGLELAIASMIFFGLADLSYKRGAAAGVKAHYFIMLQGWFFAPAVTLYGLATGTRCPRRSHRHHEAREGPRQGEV